jgi:electron transfer flavoprotein alpha subunit
MMKNIGIIIETDKEKIKETNFGMITLARTGNTRLFALVMGADPSLLKKDLESYGITTIVSVLLPEKDQNNPAVRAKALAGAIKAHEISVVFGLATAQGKDILPRIAALADAPLVMDCFDVDLEKNMAMTSQYSGKTRARIHLTGDLLVFGIRPNAIEPVLAPDAAEITTSDATHLVSEGFRVIKTGDVDGGANISLVEADVIIAGGRGMKNSENFSLLSRCAEKLNAVVASSRVPVDSGWVPYSMQVGQTGEKVNPRVYIACGISGSVQHFAGMKTAGMVIALNVDEKAFIMSNCDYYAVGDALEIIPALTALLENS